MNPISILELICRLNHDSCNLLNDQQDESHLYLIIQIEYQNLCDRDYLYLSYVFTKWCISSILIDEIIPV